MNATSCPTCGGRRVIPLEDVTPKLLDEEPELVRILSMIEQYGPGETLELLTIGGDRPSFHPVFVHDVLPVYTAELARLEADAHSKG